MPAERHLDRADSQADRAVRPPRVPRHLADRLVLELGSWLEGADPSGVAAMAGAWDAPTRLAARRLIAAHGLAALLVRDPATAPAVEGLPDDLRAWLLAEERAGRARIDRLQAELATILRAFAAAAIPVMPLKGALLWARPGAHPYRRPMADLDLLVRPGDRNAARGALTSLGYVRRDERYRRPTHDTFELPGNERIVSLEGEHPDNPRPVELHDEVKRHLWGWVDDDDLTGFLWAGARASTVVGEPALVPTDLALVGHMAIHATSDLVQARGRLIQLVDVAALATSGIGDLPHPRLAYPAIALAQRRLPRTTDVDRDDLRRLRSRVPERLARWADDVRLDTHAGLQAGRILPGDVNTLEARWNRWAPYPWRLLIADGEVPFAPAAARHVARLLRLASRRPS